MCVVIPRFFVISWVRKIEKPRFWHFGQFSGFCFSNLRINPLNYKCLFNSESADVVLYYLGDDYFLRFHKP